MVSTDWTKGTSQSTDWSKGSSVSTDWAKTSSQSTNWESDDVSAGILLFEDGSTGLYEGGTFNIGLQ